MFDLTLSTVRDAIITLDQNDKDMAKQVIEKEILIDKMERQLRKAAYSTVVIRNMYASSWYGIY